METIPGPRGLPIVGNLLDIRHEEGFLRAVENLADIYGPVFQLTIGGRTNIVCSSAELLLQLTDETQWVKAPPPGLAARGKAQGLFVAQNDDPDWAQGHRILAPKFGPLAIGAMFEGMKDIAYQMVLKWARQDQEQEILLTDEFTRLTLDTIALCTMDYRFNSFYSEKMHPFVESMLGFLALNQKLGPQPAIMRRFFGSADDAQRKEYVATMTRISQEIISRRRTRPNESDDMLNTLLYGKDPKTGESMRDELIEAQMLTFLIAGHETTSGLLSFAFMNLLQNPKTYLKAQREVDDVLGSGTIDLEKIKKLKYINAVLRETLRLYPTAPSVNKVIPPHRQQEFVTLCDGRYRVENGMNVKILLGKSMSDPSYFGEDAAEFNPDRMSEDNLDYSKHMKAWKPFGNGARSCIGQAFAWQEAVMITALILQNFDMNFVDPSYKLKIKQTLTVKPDQMYAKVRPRKGLDASSIEKRLFSQSKQENLKKDNESEPATNRTSSQKGPTILYGSNSGTCQSLAQKLASTFAIKQGLTAIIQDLDSVVNDFTTEQPFIIITSSYEGKPPDNAARFLAWLETTAPEQFVGIKYAVFGCGNRDWRDTYQRVPTTIDRLLGERGATQILAMGSTDVSKGRVLDDFDCWQQDLLQTLTVDGADVKEFRTTAPEELADISTDMRAQQLANGLSLGKVKEVRSLTEAGEPEKRHMEIELPEGMSYEVGDYLSILPINPDELVRRVINHWELPQDAVIILKASVFGSLPTNTPLGIYDLVKGFFELSQTISKSTIDEIKQFTKDKETLEHLDKLLADDDFFHKTITEQHVSLFDILSLHKSIEMPFQSFLSSLFPIHIRQYSISSSPLSNPQTCTITYSVVRHESHSVNITNEQRSTSYIHEGVASTYLAKLQPNDIIQLATKSTATANHPCPFRLPTTVSQSSTPLIMYCAGTGLAPFRGFIQQRAIMLESNPNMTLAPALLFTGCRSSTSDRLYADEFAKWEKLGAVKLRYAFSQEPDHELAAGCRYVGDRILKEQAEVRELWAKGARAYMCGSRKVQDSVKECVRRMFDTIAEERRWNVEELEAEREKFRGSLAGRAVSDVFD